MNLFVLYDTAIITYLNIKFILVNKLLIEINDNLQN